MTNLTRKAGDPLGVVVPATVECPKCAGYGFRIDMLVNGGNPSCDHCGPSAEGWPALARRLLDPGGRIPNPAAWQTCQTCGGSGDVAASDEPSPIPCHNCNGQGVTPRTLMVPEAVQVVDFYQEIEPTDIVIAVAGEYVYLSGPTHGQDITHLWPEKPCPNRGRGGGPGGQAFTDITCRACGLTWTSPSTAGRHPNQGTVRTLPKPGEWWIVGHRPCELLPVVEDCDDVPDTPELIEVLGPPANIVRYWPEGAADEDEWQDITSHFPDGLPTTDDLAGVCGELVLAEVAERAEKA